MASNFKISLRESGQTIKVRVSGDFDGSSALELLNFIRENCAGCETVVLNTDGLKEIYPFGRDMFQKNLCLLNGTHLGLVFRGKNANRLSVGARS
jgi:hypothetical protein